MCLKPFVSSTGFGRCMLLTCVILWLTDVSFEAPLAPEFSGIRTKRESATEIASLSVEWQGINTKLTPADISGFMVEYRRTNEVEWKRDSTVIPYRGTDYTYRARIKDLSSGMMYFVRINVLDRHGRIIATTPQIKARTEEVKKSSYWKK